MKDLVKELSSAYSGSGTNHENESFVCHLTPIGFQNLHSVMFKYEAFLADSGRRIHSENVILGPNSNGEPILIVQFEEIPSLTEFNLKGSGINYWKFGYLGHKKNNFFNSEVIIEFRDSTLIYSHLWAFDSPPVERSTSKLEIAK